MKNKLLLLAILAGLNCFGQDGGSPFASQYKENGYSALEAAEIIGDTTNGSLKIKTYTALFQKIGEEYGWIDSVHGKKMTFGYTMYILRRLKESNDSWLINDVLVGSIKGNFAPYFVRPSYSDRINKICGPEPVGVLDVTAMFGWKDKNGRPFPKRIVMARRCGNPLLDYRVASVATEPLKTDPIVAPVKNVIHDTIYSVRVERIENTTTNCCPQPQPSTTGFYTVGSGMHSVGGEAYYPYPTYYPVNYNPYFYSSGIRVNFDGYRGRGAYRSFSGVSGGRGAYSSGGRHR